MRHLLLALQAPQKLIEGGKQAYKSLPAQIGPTLHMLCAVRHRFAQLVSMNFLHEFES